MATRQRISDAATQLFMERGFDEVTVDEIAEAAKVSRMTVFNHFSRKEDMLFDLDDVGRQDVLTAISSRAAGVTPLEAVRLFAHQAVQERRPYMLFCEYGADQFLSTVQASEALLARARSIRDELTDLLAGALAKAAGVRRPDSHAKLAASLIVATWNVAFLEAHGEFQVSGSAARAYKKFLAIVDQGSSGVNAALKGTRYA